MKTKIAHIIAAASALFTSTQTFSAGFEQVQFWTGTGTNRAALVIHWSSPEVRNNSTVPPPIAEQSLMWGYRWNGEATAEAMVRAISAADPRLFTIVNVSAFGPSVLGFGYDLNNNRVFGLSAGSFVLGPSVFTNGMINLPTSGADAWQSLDPADLFWSGWTGPGWEMWQEQGASGGFTDAPDRGTNIYWTPEDPSQPYSGVHGQWQLAGTGLSGLILKDGSWVGFAVVRGGFDFANPTAPGTVAYGLHKQAPSAPAPAPQPVSPFAASVVQARGTFGDSPYDDPASILGMPSTDFYDPSGEVGGGAKERRVKIVEGPFNYDLTQTNKLIITFDTDSSVIVRFDQPVTNNPANPYGIDFLVFGNSFYPADGFVDDSADMNKVKIMGGLFGEPVKVSVSPGFTGLPGEVESDPGTWPWYRYENGPFGDTAFPTQGYVWNRATTNWSPRPMDFTKPVNPALASIFDAGNISVADGLDYYNGSGGGTGFDLAPSGFSSVRYARLEGIAPDWVGGEIDALAVVRPATLNESLILAPSNLANNASQLVFADPANPEINRLKVDFTALDIAAKVETAKTFPTDFSSLIAMTLQVSPVLADGSVNFAADTHIALKGIYNGQGNDLRILQWNGANWIAAAMSFSPASNTITIAGLTNSTALAVVRATSPSLTIARVEQGVEIRFQAIPGWTYLLEKTTNFSSWTEVTRTAPQLVQDVALVDLAKNPYAFYRIHVIQP